MAALLITGYAFLLVWTIYEISATDFRVITFEDGVLIGLVFFLVVPLSFLFYDGEIRSADMLAGPYQPVADWQTSIQIGIGWTMVLVYHALCRLFWPRVKADILERAANEPSDELSLFVVAYFFCTLIMFVAAGKLTSSHWQENLGEQLSSNTFVVIVGNFANVYRGAVFGMLYFFWSTGRISRPTVLIVGAVVFLADLILTFNRITAAYYAIIIILMYRRLFLLQVVAFFALAPFVGYLSAVWTMVRGLALVDGGYSVAGFVEAFSDASSVMHSADFTLANAFSSMFDSENIIVFDWLVKNVGYSFPVLHGFTFFGRLLTVLVPSTIWAGKPPVFGTMVGGAIQGIDGLALNSTLFGEAYGNFYTFWWLVLLLTLLALSAIYHRVARRWSFAAALSFFVGFALWRFDMAFATISLVAILSFGGALSLWRLVRPAPEAPSHQVEEDWQPVRRPRKRGSDLDRARDVDVQ